MVTLASQERAELAVTDNVLTVSGLEKRFGDRRAVDGVTFAVAPGETYGLLGPNGAGKTAWITVLSKGGSVGDIAGQLLVLGLFAAGLLVAASYRLHRRLIA
jgi:ABC-2 type transport system ATP-binding protein